jgi:ABC-type Na+ efflux pump permease subunit
MTRETNTAGTTTDPRSRGVRRRASVVFAVLVGLVALAVLLQGLWAGIFLQHDGHRDDADSWIEVHALGGEVALVLAALATAWALWRLRARRELWLGSLALTVLLVVEAYLGGLIRDDGKDTLTAVHVPLALAIMALAVWLPLRAAPRAANPLPRD